MSLLTQFYPGPGSGGGGNVNPYGDGGNFLQIETVSGHKLYYTSLSLPGGSYTGSALQTTNQLGPSTYWAKILTSSSYQWDITQDLVGIVNTLESLSFAYLRMTGVRTVSFSAGSLFTDLSLGNVSMTGGSIMDFSNCASLSNVSIGAIVSSGATWNMSGCALTQASVDNILAAFAATQNTSGGNTTIQLNGGTSAAPSATGAADVTYLTGAGFSVTTN
jgi:hypothetical protein